MKPVRGFALVVMLIIIALAIGIGGTVIYFKFYQKPTFSPSPTTVDRSIDLTQPTPSPVNETANWKTYTGNLIKVAFKLPSDWTTEEVDGVEIGFGNYGKVNTNIKINNSEGKEILSIIDNFYGGFEELKQISEKNIEVSGIKTKETKFQDLVGSTQIHVTLDVDSKKYLIIAGNLNETEENTYNQILSTFKFLE